MRDAPNTRSSTVLASPEPPDNTQDLMRIMWEEDLEITLLVGRAREELSEDTVDDDPPTSHNMYLLIGLGANMCWLP